MWNVLEMTYFVSSDAKLRELNVAHWSIYWLWFHYIHVRAVLQLPQSHSHSFLSYSTPAGFKGYVTFAHNVPEYILTQKCVLKVTPQVAALGAESAVYGSLVCLTAFLYRVTTGWTRSSISNLWRGLHKAKYTSCHPTTSKLKALSSTSKITKWRHPSWHSNWLLMEDSTLYSWQFLIWQQ